ncbi:MAG TPA: non-canonical purine NTP pyrophosphatase [Vicinamibacterales bacterium]
MKTLLVATTNRGKLVEISAILDGVPFEILTLADFPGIAAPEETGRTFSENARAKAIYYAQATGALTVAEDSGLEINALDGAPGVESARYGGADASYPEKFVRIYDALRARHTADSPARRAEALSGGGARFVCALALASSRVLFEATGVIEGQIAPEPKGEGGFGYDPIFFYPPFGVTLAEAGDRKSAVSHRGHAFRALRTFLLSGRLRQTQPPDVGLGGR